MQLRRGLLVSLAVVAAVGPTQWAVAHIGDALRVQIEFEFLPGLSGVPVWPFAGTLAGLIVALGGSLRMGAFAATVLAVGGGLFLPNASRSIAIFSIYSPEAVILLTIGISLVIGMRHGGSAYLRHWVLRGLLAQARLAPWDYVAFLEHAARMNLMRHRGGGYEFVHRLVMEHFVRDR